MSDNKDNKKNLTVFDKRDTKKIKRNAPKRKKIEPKNNQIMADKKKKNTKIVLIIISILVSLALIVAVVLLSKKQQTKQSITPNLPTTKYTTIDNIEKLKEFDKQNSDAVAWLRLTNTAIDDPVVQAKDNDFYLRKTELKKYNIYGCYFADYECKMGDDRTSLSENTIIYGHSAPRENPNGKKFEQLFKYRDLEFLQKNPIIYLSLPNENISFEIFAVFYTNTDFYYISPQPLTEDFENFTKEIYDKNEFIFENGKISKNDKILTLSTCAYRYDKANKGDHRFVIMARMLDKNETPKTTKITVNPNPQRPSN
ncbi:MAG: class B sortase [Clostridia bacterium]|nr:class B sortase [Clostridia bacterium]